MKTQKFETELLDGHKGCAVIVPFDPRELWGTEPTLVPSAEYGQRPGHLVTAKINGHRFDGWIGHRWGRFFILVSDELQRAAGVSAGDVVAIEVTPRSQAKSKGKPR